ncbi:YidC/Oxa1 family membrane protein insertase [Frateuria hangzhouensis]|uniref:YidC/Oxa1 family membrane protein insertase n=1 Tax=Frateuria hangzhouensis TaxID=2995589 RepID=UPI0022608597|nr:membrane protein insertase YidC [Frateuria sp. STR12]MCX7512211.1 membrane protein insertase YidC [Frateuria sp. STR12]
MWSTFVDGLSALLAQLAVWLDGSYGLAVIVLALLVRLAMLPMTLRTAEQGWWRQQQLLELKPKLAQLRERHAGDPASQAQAMQALYREHGISGGLGSSLLVALVQAPLGAGIYAAIRQGVAGAGSFLWIPKLARPDAWLALVVGLLSFAALLLNPAMSEQTRTLLHWLPVVFSVLMVWHLAAGLGLYWFGSSGVGLLQMAMLRRRVRNRSVR